MHMDPTEDNCLVGSGGGGSGGSSGGGGGGIVDGIIDFD